MKLLIFSFALFSLSTSCHPQIVSGVEGNAPTTGAFAKEGWRPFSTARTGDGPGRIFRKNAKGAIFGVATVAVEPHSDLQQTSAITKQEDFSIEEILSTMGVLQVELPAELQTQIKKKATAEAKSVGGTREYLDDKDLSTEILSNTLKGIPIRKHNKYYIIRETFNTNNITYKISKEWMTNIGIEAQIKSVISTKGNIKWNDGSQVSLDAKFSEPYRIWYKAEKLDIKENLGGADGMGNTVQIHPGIAEDFVLPPNIQSLP